MRNKVQQGNVIDYTNSTGSDISSGEFVILKGRVGIATVDIANGDVGSVEMEGVFEGSALTSETFAEGELLYLNSSKLLTKTRAGGKSFVGRATEAKSTTGKSCKFRLEGEAVNPAAASTAAQFVAPTAPMVGVSGAGNNAAPLTTTESRLDAVEAAVALHETILKKLGMRNY